MITYIDILEDLYSRELNFEISSFWDAGYSVKLGDKTGGYIWEGDFDDLREGICKLAKQADRHYPKS